ncbi:MAG: hypothetical protein MPI95_03325 [Nitrosopumilus sp.]|nr:hypothetical protein [Nitrosopumilus sp.]
MDPMRERVERLRRVASSAKRRAGLYSELAGLGGSQAASSLGALRKAPAPGKKLQKIGFMMLWIPEPTGVTCAVGGPMIVAGRYLDKKYNGATIGDVGAEAGRTLSAIGDFRRSIT